MKTRLILLTIIIFSLPACISYSDVSSSVKGDYSLIDLPAGYYTSVSWWSSDAIAFIYSESKTAFGINDKIYVFSPQTNQSYELYIPKRSECRKELLTHLDKLPNGELGIIINCFAEWIQPTLFGADENGNLEAIYKYPFSHDFNAGNYTFNNDMSIAFLEGRGGDPLGGTLYHAEITSDADIEQIFADFKRVRSPAWSFDDKIIAFAGTENYEGEITVFGDIVDLTNFPWDLYLMDSDGQNLRFLLRGVVKANNIKWVPNHNTWLSFSGDYKGSEGIWIVNIETREVTRIWDQREAYDWSPDGTRLVIMTDNVDGYEDAHPVIVTAPKIEE